MTEQTNNPSPVDLPYRLRESAFRKYEADIARAVNSYPSVTIFEPKGSVGTYEARFRDAMNSLFENRWETSLVNIPAFRAYYPFIIVSRSKCGKKVFVGEKSHIQQIKLESEKVEETPTVKAGEVEPYNANELGLSGDEIRLLCILASKRLLSRPVKLWSLTQEHADVLEADYDVRIDPSPDGGWVVS